MGLTENSLGSFEAGLQSQEFPDNKLGKAILQRANQDVDQPVTYSEIEDKPEKEDDVLGQ